MQNISIFFFVLFLGCLPLGIQAQTTLKGKVVNAVDGSPVLAANVFLKNHRSTGVATDLNGNFRLQIAEELRGDTLIISSVGYKKKEIPISSLSWNKVNKFTLKEDISTLNQVVVSPDGSLAEEFSTKTLNRISIYMSPVSSADPLKAITGLPSSTNTSENANPALRGSPGAYSRVILNGVPLYKPVRNSQLNGLGNFSILNTELIASQEVFAGNPPLTYGNSIAGLVEINSRNVLDQSYLKASVSLANLGILYSDQLKDQHTFIQLFGNLQFSDAFLAVNSGSFPFLKNFESQDLGINLRYTISDHWSANTYAYAINEGYKAESLRYNYRGNMEGEKKRFFNVFNLEYAQSKMIISFNNKVNLSDTDYSFGNIDSNMKELKLYNAMDMKYFPAESWSVQLGLSDDYFNNQYNSMYPYYFYALSPADSSSYYEYTTDNHNLETYAYGRYKTQKLVVGGGLRKNIPVETQENYLSYQGSIRYNFSSSSSALLSAGSYNGYTIPTYYIQRFEQISSVQYAVEYHYDTDNTDIGIALYKKEEEGPEYFDESGTSLATSRHIRGIEVSLEQYMNHFRINGSYTWLDSQFKNSNQQEWYNSYNDMDYLLKLSLSYNNTAVVNASISYITRPGHYYTPVISSQKIDTQSAYKPIYGTYNARQLGNYHKFDFTVNKVTTVGNTTMIPFLTLSNVLDHKNQSQPIYTQDYKSIKDYWHYQQRQIYVGVQFTF